MLKLSILFGEMNTNIRQVSHEAIMTAGATRRKSETRHRLICVCIFLLVAATLSPRIHRRLTTGIFHSSTNIVAVCITGQVARLELVSKVSNLLQPNRDKGIRMHLFLVLDSREVLYSKEEFYHSVEKRDASAALEEALESLAGWPMHVRVVNETNGPNFEYITGDAEHRFYLPHVNDIDRTAMIRKHLKQFWGISECARMISAQERTTGRSYDVILRLRDNSIVLNPFVIPMLTLRQNPGAYVKQCCGWGGINDKVMLVSRAFMQSALHGWVDHFLLRSTLNLTHLSNPERVLHHALRMETVPIFQVSADVLPIVDGRIHYLEGLCLVTESKDCRPSEVYNLKIPNCTLVESEKQAEKHDNSSYSAKSL